MKLIEILKNGNRKRKRPVKITGRKNTYYYFTKR